MFIIADEPCHHLKRTRTLLPGIVTRSEEVWSWHNDVAETLHGHAVFVVVHVICPAVRHCIVATKGAEGSRVGVLGVVLVHNR